MGRREMREFCFLSGVEEEVEAGELQDAAFLVKPLTIQMAASKGSK
jgi:hypothetical protein